jgi:hypothetical protein
MPPTTVFVLVETIGAVAVSTKFWRVNDTLMSRITPVTVSMLNRGSLSLDPVIDQKEAVLSRGGTARKCGMFAEPTAIKEYTRFLPNADCQVKLVWVGEVPPLGNKYTSTQLILTPFIKRDMATPEPLALAHCKMPKTSALENTRLLATPEAEYRKV